ncbi:MAG: relaxase/mobilization nuclease domain-containing protein [Betaproteobacteria bacterium]|nr:relaxase/mobilization nuclease domain-containing protein [Betaproteobacteria bacterium]
MIIKKIRAKAGARAKRKSKAAHIRDLVDYMREPHNRNPAEKVLYAGGRGFIADGHEAQREEMVALASEVVRSANPVNHYVISWREGEQPTPEQIEQAVEIVLDEFGMQGHQVVYALHHNTDNLHLHVAINRVHPETLKCVEINKGFDIEAAHRAIARIEHEQGWERERNGRYQVSDVGKLGREHVDTDTRRKPSQQRRDMENQTGEKSAERVAIENAAPIIKQARTWEQLHRELAAKGLRYERKGSGALIYVGDVAVKASAADRSASLSALQKRLGPFEAAHNHQPIAVREPEPLTGGEASPPGWQDYIAGRKEHYANKAQAKLELDLRIEHERGELAARQKQERQSTFAGSWKGHGAELNAMRSIMAAQHAAAKAELRERHARERAQHRQRFRPWPGFEEWQRSHGNPELADAWRHRASEPQHMEGEGEPRPKLRDIRAFTAEVVGANVHYTRQDTTGRNVPASFIDRGRRIDIHDWRDHDSLLAALQVASQKWPKGITLTGSDEYKAACVKLAVANGFRIANEELQDAIAAERERLQKERFAGRGLDLSRSIATPEISVPVEKVTPPAAPLSPHAAYKVHCQDIIRRQKKGRLDPSRIDSMVALRMRMTGHSREEVEATIRQCAAERQSEGRDWDRYAQRTTAYAFGAAGNKQTERLARYTTLWRRMEGCEVIMIEQERRVTGRFLGIESGAAPDRAILRIARAGQEIRVDVAAAATPSGLRPGDPVKLSFDPRVGTQVEFGRAPRSERDKSLQ